MKATDVLRAALAGHLSPLSLEAVLRRHLENRAVPVRAIPLRERESLAVKLSDGVALFSSSEREDVERIVRTALDLDVAATSGARPTIERTHIAIRGELDVNVARSEARRIALVAGLRSSSAVKVATSVSELARNIILYASTGEVAIETGARDGAPVIRIVARDDGPGIDDAKLAQILDGTYVSRSGLGKGIGAVKRIADHFEIASAAGKGTSITVEFAGG